MFLESEYTTPADGIPKQLQKGEIIRTSAWSEESKLLMFFLISSCYRILWPWPAIAYSCEHMEPK